MKLCQAGNENIVDVLRHGWFDIGSYRFIDMELCVTNLQDYIDHRKNAIVQRPDLPNEYAFVREDSPPHVHVLNVWTIMHHISQGVEFIHNLGYSHRDLKPANGLQVFTLF